MYGSCNRQVQSIINTTCGEELRSSAVEMGEIRKVTEESYISDVSKSKLRTYVSIHQSIDDFQVRRSVTVGGVFFQQGEFFLFFVDTFCGIVSLSQKD